MAVGKGTEDVSLYHNTELIFCNIDNIHVMRSSAANFAESQVVGSLNNIQMNTLREIATDLSNNYSYFNKVDDSGWDRTAQICSLTQIMLDPYFRTMKGLAVLIEKDWCSFGYKFQDRCGHGREHNSSSDERSPVFLQFLDSLFQIMQQFPSVFEYTPYLLIFLADHLHSCLFGNFLGNCDKDRSVNMMIQDSTRSIWTYVFQHEEMFINSSGCTRYVSYDEPIWPNVSYSKMVVNDRFWNRWDIAAHPNSLQPESYHWHDDWGFGPETKFLCELNGRASSSSSSSSPMSGADGNGGNGTSSISGSTRLSAGNSSLGESNSYYQINADDFSSRQSSTNKPSQSQSDGNMLNNTHISRVGVNAYANEVNDNLNDNMIIDYPQVHRNNNSKRNSRDDEDIVYEQDDDDDDNEDAKQHESFYTENPLRRSSSSDKSDKF
eukprot:gene6333-8720_t